MFMNACPVLIEGEWRTPRGNGSSPVYNPSRGEVIAEVPMCGADEVDKAVKAAAAAYKTWRNVPIGQRARIMLKLQELIRRDMKKLAACLTAEQGKTLPDAEGDIFRGLEVVEHATSVGTLSLGEIAENVVAMSANRRTVVCDRGATVPTNAFSVVKNRVSCVLGSDR